MKILNFAQFWTILHLTHTWWWKMVKMDRGCMQEFIARLLVPRSTLGHVRSLTYDVIFESLQSRAARKLDIFARKWINRYYNFSANHSPNHPFSCFLGRWFWIWHKNSNSKKLTVRAMWKFWSLHNFEQFCISRIRDDQKLGQFQNFQIARAVNYFQTWSF